MESARHGETDRGELEGRRGELYQRLPPEAPPLRQPVHVRPRPNRVGLTRTSLRALGSARRRLCSVERAALDASPDRSHPACMDRSLCSDALSGNRLRRNGEHMVAIPWRPARAGSHPRGHTHQDCGGPELEDRPPMATLRHSLAATAQQVSRRSQHRPPRFGRFHARGQVGLRTAAAFAVFAASAARAVGTSRRATGATAPRNRLGMAKRQRRC